MTFFKKNTAVRLSTKLYIAFALILILPTITAGFLSFNSAKEQLENKLLTSAEENIKLLNSNINNTISPKVHDANFFSEKITEELYGTGNGSAGAQAKFQQYIELHPEVQSIYVGTKDGKMITYPELDLPKDYDPRERPWYEDAQSNKGKAIITNPYVDASTGEMVVTITKETADGSGVIGIDININALKATAEEVSIGKKGFAILLDKDQNFIVSPTAKAGDKAQDSFYSKMFEEKTGNFQYTLKGENKIMYFSTNNVTGWKVAGTMVLSEVNDAAQPILNTTLLVIITAIIIGSGLIILIVRSITKRLKDLQQKAKTISEGDLTEVIDLTKKDEIGNLSQSFHDMQTSLRNLLGTVDHHAVQVGSAAEELNASAEQTSEATQQVATAIQHVAASAEQQTYSMDTNNTLIEKLVNGAKIIAKSSIEVSELTKATTNKAAEGEKSVKQTVNQMNLIHKSVTESNAIIGSLSDRSKEIYSILNVITGISEQTNLLALNAAIEAARAGEAGKGFAIVADEVRKLAEQSQVSAKQIAELINAIQHDTKSTVKNMATVAENVQHGLTVSEETIQKFTEIFAGMQEISPKIESVSSTIQEMTGSIQEVETTANNISDLAKNNAASSEEVAASTEEQLASMEEISSSANMLTNMAEELSDIMKKFKY
ncbi:methyl-accepting chemotaxis protein [Niallia sp. NCCP-28]|uniref:methyl-accepting chemotaxis protein n=1 Tax=Niallia sp. NCCP-28 TaxID=2934712 RepID=UPI00208B6AF7|nr:methyl-accepting chemotaxis protein [Niallia sp. NCCP-28]GKU82177.1 methyl-accepting chemotaxis protein [Niallia sp. NCCP-28]